MLSRLPANSSILCHVSLLQLSKIPATRLVWNLVPKLLTSVASRSNCRYGIQLAKNVSGSVHFLDSNINFTAFLNILTDLREILAPRVDLIYMFKVTINYKRHFRRWLIYIQHSQQGFFYCQSEQYQI